MRILIHRGADTIGGNCVEVASDNSRILLDFGWPLGPPDNKDFQQQFRGKKTEELIKSGFIPNIAGLYPPSPLTFTAALLSHSHPDHYGFLSHVNPALPIYATRTTGRLIYAATLFGQAEPVKARITSIQPGLQFNLGDFEITPYEADHSAAGALAFLIRDTNTGETLFYSGDIAGHLNNIASFNLLLQRKWQVDYLILEGTNIARETGPYNSEQAVESALTKEFTSREGLVFMACSSQNLPRLQSAYTAARAAGKYLVIDPYTAFIIKMYSEEQNNPLRFDSEGIKILLTRSSLTRKVQGFAGLYAKMINSRVTDKEILAAPTKYVVKDSWDMRHRLIPRANAAGIKPSLIYSMWEGYLPRERQFWDDNNVEITKVHTSGHAYAAELSRLGHALKPKGIFPIHTFNKDHFSSIFPDIPILSSHSSTLNNPDKPLSGWSATL